MYAKKRQVQPTPHKISLESLKINLATSYISLAHSPPIFTADMTTYYCPNMEEALRRAKKAGREPGCYFGGITIKSGRRGFAVYRDGKVVAQYTAIGRQE